MKRIVMFSGGVSSWAAARRVADIHGTEGMVLLFADVKMEDEDNYRFVAEAAANIGVPITTIADGRNPWQVFRDERMMGNSRVDLCSRILKRELLDRWIRENCKPEETRCYTGIDWTEEHRHTRLAARRLPWIYEAPLCEKPLMDKRAQIAALKTVGIEPPRLYAMGFGHANCGGFCVKAGQGHFANLLKQMPERYAWHEEREREMRAFLGKDVSILKDRAGGNAKTLTLEALRLRIEAKSEVDMFDIGGCGCAVDDNQEPAP